MCAVLAAITEVIKSQVEGTSKHLYNPGFSHYVDYVYVPKLGGTVGFNERIGCTRRTTYVIICERSLIMDTEYSVFYYFLKDTDVYCL